MNTSSSALPAHRLLIGTYTRDGSRGIYAVNLDRATGRLSEPVLAAETGNPSFLAISPDKRLVFAVNDSPDLAVSFSIDHDRQLRLLGGPKQSTTPPPSHVAVDHTGRSLLSTHFHKGFVAVLPIGANGILGAPNVIMHHGHGLDPIRQSSPHPHSAVISPDNRFALVCDLGLDKVFSYALDATEARLTPANPAFVATAPGAGPRHSAFSPDGHHFYVINEIGGTIGTYRYDSAGGSLTALATHSTLPPNFTGQNTTAEVRVHPNGRFVYGSNRGHDSIAVFARDRETGLLSPVEIVPCGGQHPRHFALSPDGDWLVCANMNSNSLTVFRVTPDTGRLAAVPSSVNVSLPVCVLFCA